MPSQKIENFLCGDERAKRTKGITLIALIITIIILLILAGVAISQLTGNGLFAKVEIAGERSKYSAAKEIVEMKLMEIQSDCIEKDDPYILQPAIYNGMDKAEDITIQNFYKKTAKVKDGLGEPSAELEAIAVSVDLYPKYVFLIGDTGEIIGASTKKVKDLLDILDFTEIDKFEEELFNEKINVSEDKSKPKDITVEIPSIEENVDKTKPINIETYIAIKNNSKNTLNISGIEEISYVMQTKTENISFENNIVIANSKAGSEDGCKIQIIGKYQGQSYTNNVTIYVEPKNKTTVQDKEGNTKEAFAIYTKQDLIRIQEIVNTEINCSCNVKIMKNIELNKGLYNYDENGKVIFNETATQYKSIGTVDKPFSGVFDGNNAEISGLYMTGGTKQALIGMISEDGEVKDLQLKDICIEGSLSGGITVCNEGTITRCKVKNITMQGGDNGGIASLNNGNIEKCAVESCYIFDGRSLGGIVCHNGVGKGYQNYYGVTCHKNTGYIGESYVTGYLEGRQVASLSCENGHGGGIGNINNCYSRALVIHYEDVGSLIIAQSYGGGNGTIENSYYKNTSYGLAYIVDPKYTGTIKNSYHNPNNITSSILNTTDEEIWVEDTSGLNDGYPILKWQLD